jgi:hypothetical protein
MVPSGVKTNTKWPAAVGQISLLMGAVGRRHRACTMSIKFWGLDCANGARCNLFLIYLIYLVLLHF